MQGRYSGDLPIFGILASDITHRNVFRAKLERCFENISRIPVSNLRVFMHKTCINTKPLQISKQPRYVVVLCESLTERGVGLGALALGGDICI